MPDDEIAFVLRIHRCEIYTNHKFLLVRVIEPASAFAGR
jgi:hypothetical protein